MRGLAPKANEDRPLRGIALVLVAFASFSFIDSGAKWLALAGLPVFQVAFMRYLGHFVISLTLIGRGGFSAQRFLSERLGLVVLRGALLLGSTLFNFLAVRYLPLTLTATIFFSAPIMICALSWPLLGQRVGIWRWSAIMAGFVGVLIAIRPFDAEFHWATLISLCSAACLAFYNILTGKLSGVVSPTTMQFYGGLVGTVALLPFALATWQTPADAWDWAILLGIGGFGWFGHELLTRAHGYATASALTPFTYVFIVYLTFWSVVVFDQPPDAWTLVGAVVVVLSGLVIWMRERHLARRGRRLKAEASLSRSSPR